MAIQWKRYLGIFIAYLLVRECTCLMYKRYIENGYEQEVVQILTRANELIREGGYPNFTPWERTLIIMHAKAELEKTKEFWEKRDKLTMLYVREY